MSRGNKNDEDVQYEDIDDSGEPVVDKHFKKNQGNPARLPKTPLQERALKSCRLKQFPDRLQHDAFRDVEALSLGAGNEDYLVKKHIENCIVVWEIANRVAMTRPLRNLITYMSNVNARNDWIAKNRKRLLANRQTEEMKVIQATLAGRPKQEENDDASDIDI